MVLEPRAGVSAGSRDLEDSSRRYKTPGVALSIPRGATATAAGYMMSAQMTWEGNLSCGRSRAYTWLVAPTYTVEREDISPRAPS